MASVNSVPFAIAQAQDGSFVYLGKSYIEVPLTSPVFSYPLYKDLNIINNDEAPSTEPLEPVKLIRMYHPREIKPLFYKKNGEISECDCVLKLSGYVPYEWVPVKFEENNEIKWYKHIM